MILDLDVIVNDVKLWPRTLDSPSHSGSIRDRHITLEKVIFFSNRFSHSNHDQMWSTRFHCTFHVKEVRRVITVMKAYLFSSVAWVVNQPLGAPQIEVCWPYKDNTKNHYQDRSTDLLRRSGQCTTARDMPTNETRGLIENITLPLRKTRALHRLEERTYLLPCSHVRSSSLLKGSRCDNHAGLAFVVTETKSEDG